MLSGRAAPHQGFNFMLVTRHRIGECVVGIALAVLFQQPHIANRQRGALGGSVNDGFQAHPRRFNGDKFHNTDDGQIQFPRCRRGWRRWRRRSRAQHDLLQHSRRGTLFNLTHRAIRDFHFRAYNCFGIPGGQGLATCQSRDRDKRYNPAEQRHAFPWLCAGHPAGVKLLSIL